MSTSTPSTPLSRSGNTTPLLAGRNSSIALHLGRKVQISTPSASRLQTGPSTPDGRLESVSEKVTLIATSTLSSCSHSPNPEESVNLFACASTNIAVCFAKKPTSPTLCHPSPVKPDLVTARSRSPSTLTASAYPSTTSTFAPHAFLPPSSNYSSQTLFSSQQTLSTPTSPLSKEKRPSEFSCTKSLCDLREIKESTPLPSSLSKCSNYLLSLPSTGFSDQIHRAPIVSDITIEDLNAEDVESLFPKTPSAFEDRLDPNERERQIAYLKSGLQSPTSAAIENQGQPPQDLRQKKTNLSTCQLQEQKELERQKSKEEQKRQERKVAQFNNRELFSSLFRGPEDSLDLDLPQTGSVHPVFNLLVNPDFNPMPPEILKTLDQQFPSDGAQEQQTEILKPLIDCKKTQEAAQFRTKIANFQISLRKLLQERFEAHFSTISNFLATADNHMENMTQLITEKNNAVQSFNAQLSEYLGHKLLLHFVQKPTFSETDFAAALSEAFSSAINGTQRAYLLKFSFNDLLRKLKLDLKQGSFDLATLASFRAAAILGKGTDQFLPSTSKSQDGEKKEPLLKEDALYLASLPLEIQSKFPFFTSFANEIWHAPDLVKIQTPKNHYQKCLRFFVYLLSNQADSHFLDKNRAEFYQMFVEQIQPIHI